MLLDKVEFYPSYYVCVNPYVIEQSWQEIQMIDCPKFLSRHGTQFLESQDDLIFLRTLDRPIHFSQNPARGLWEGATVTFCAMQLAYFMGFTEVVLIGVDHNFVTKGEADQLVVSDGDDPNHFAPNYFGKGTKWAIAKFGNVRICLSACKRDV